MGDEHIGAEAELASPEEEADLPIPRLDNVPVLLTGLGPEQEPAEPCQDPDFSHWANWAHQRHVRDLMRCPQSGELWLATSGGVLRWYADRDRFTRYTSEHGLCGNSIAAITVDGLGQPWCAPDHGGLYVYKNGAWLSGPAEAFAMSPVRALTTDYDGQVWAGTRDGLYQLGIDGAVAREFPFPAVEPPRSIAVTESGDAWVCSTQGLFLFRKDEVRQVGKQPTSLTLACFGRSLWVGKMDGLVCIDLESGRAQQKAGWPRGAVSALLPTAGDVLLVCDDWLGSISGADWDRLLRIEGHVSKLVGDGADGVWLATHRGLLHWSETEPAEYLETQTPPDLINPLDVPMPDAHLNNLIQCLAVEEREEGTVLWGGTHQGLFQYDPRAFASSAWAYVPVDAVRDVQALTVGVGAGDLYLSSWTGGVFSYERSGSVEKMPGILAPVLSLTAGVDGTRWAVGMDGLYRCQGDRWELVLGESQLPVGAKLQVVAQIGADQVWLGTSSGLMAYNPQDDVLALPRNHPFERPTTALAYDASHALLWAGTDAGLFGLRRRGDGWEADDKSPLTVLNSGLAANRILSLAVDASDPAQVTLWVGTACGLSQFSYQA